MARPTKQGLDYFPFDVDFFSDEKIEAISGEFGIKGEIVTIKLLTTVYRNGYFIEWSDLLKMKLLKNLNGISKELLEQIVSRLVKWGFFDEHLFNSDKILTSSGIQKRYFEATKRRKDVLINTKWLLKGINVNINQQAKVVNVNINTQSKVKERKVKEKKVDDYTKININDFSKLFKQDQIHYEQLQMNYKGLNVDACLEDFLTDRQKQGRLIDTYESIRGHLFNWVKLKVG